MSQHIGLFLCMNLHKNNRLRLTAGGMIYMENKNVFEEVVKTLKEDSLSLQKRFHTLQEKNDIRGSIDCLRLLKDTLSLIRDYDWELKYSEYETDGHKEVAIWEQNHCGDIRNYKRWIVKS